jgi:hypothetical protein
MRQSVNINTLNFKNTEMQKEIRFYVLDATKAGEMFAKMSGYELENWKLYEEHHGKLTDEAEHFISACEQEGTVYSAVGFMNAINIEETIGANDYVYVTNNY